MRNVKANSREIHGSQNPWHCPTGIGEGVIVWTKSAMLLECIKKWVLKPHCGLGFRLNDPAFQELATGFPHWPCGVAPGFLHSPCSSLASHSQSMAVIPFASQAEKRTGRRSVRLGCRSWAPSRGHRRIGVVPRMLAEVFSKELFASAETFFSQHDRLWLNSNKGTKTLTGLVISGIVGCGKEQSRGIWGAA